jgi:hypothetical protein
VESPKLAVGTAPPRSDDSEANVDETEMINPSSELPQSESVNVWPDEAAESAFLAETRGVETAAKPVVEAKMKEETSLAPLPKLDELVNRIPTESRELLEELFRAKFTTVRRVKQSDLKA